MNDFPDILGMELHDATALLEAEGLDFIVAETKPARKELTEGLLRVIKVQIQDETMKLTVCKI